MIRGAIEQVVRNRISGWVWSPDTEVKGRTVLAFLDDACIGAGRVEGFRQDLKDAGLGDGIAGFDFELGLENAADAPRVTVRLEESDALLMQRQARIVPLVARAAPAVQREAAANLGPATLEWMRSRGWLCQSDYDFLRFIRRLGVYDRSLVVAVDSRAEGREASLQDPMEMARHMLQLLRLEDVAVQRHSLATPREWRRLAEQQEMATGPGAVLALHSHGRGRLPVVEGSHTRPEMLTLDAGPPGCTDYMLGPDRLVFLDARCGIGPGADFPAEGVEVFFLAA